MRPKHQAIPYVVALASIALTTLLLEPWHEQLSVTTVALALLLVILFLATFFGRNPALPASLLAMLCFNYFFLPPVRTWTIGAPQNLSAWAAFILTALTAGANNHGSRVAFTIPIGDEDGWQRHTKF